MSIYCFIGILSGHVLRDFDLKVFYVYFACLVAKIRRAFCSYLVY